MEVEQEKVYVVVGKDVQEGLETLAWALKNWSSAPVCFVILHVSSSSKDFLYTPFGKLPLNSVNEERLEEFRAREDERVDKLLCNYLAFCCKVKAEVMKVEKFGEPIHEVILGLISSIQITQLVLGLALSKSSLWKAKGTAGGLFYVHKHKPEFCNLFIVFDSHLVFAREENGKVYFEDYRRVVVADFRKKSKRSPKGWLGKMLTDNTSCNASPKSEHGSSPQSTISSFVTSTSTPEHNQSADRAEEDVEKYRQCLMSSNALNGEEEEFMTPLAHMDKCRLEITDTDVMTAARRAKALKAFEETKRVVEEKKMEAKDEAERHSKAQRSVSLFQQRAEEMEAHTREEKGKQAQLKKELEKVRQELQEESKQITEGKSELRSMHEFEGELKTKLDAHSLERSRIEYELEKVVQMKVEMLQEIEQVRHQRDIQQRKIELIAEAKARGSSESLCQSFREFSAEEVGEATNGFSERMAVWVGGEGVVFRGRLSLMDVAIKCKAAYCLQSLEEFNAQVEILRQIRHPHLVTMIGACIEHRCIVFEYLVGGSLRNILFSSCNRSKNQVPLLPWYTRIRVAAEVCSALGFLHSTRPKPTPHGHLDVSHVLLDRNLVTKISGPEYASTALTGSDVAALGILVIQLLTGKEMMDTGEVQRAIEEMDFTGIIDREAGDWPLDLAAEFASIGLRYTTQEIRMSDGVKITAELMNELQDMKSRAEKRLMDRKDANIEDRLDLPGFFFCPILQEVMKQPYVAADGFSYELEAIKEWLDGGHETSPMTNLKLQNKLLTPNHTLQSLIINWHHITPPRF